MGFNVRCELSGAAVPPWSDVFARTRPGSAELSRHSRPCPGAGSSLTLPATNAAGQLLGGHLKLLDTVFLVWSGLIHDRKAE